MKEIVARYWPAPPAHEMEAASDRVRQHLRNEFEKHDTSLRSLYGDGWSAPPLELNEFQILTAASLLGGEGTGRSVYRKALGWGSSELVALAFDSLEAQGMVVALGTEDQGPQGMNAKGEGRRREALGARGRSATQF